MPIYPAHAQTEIWSHTADTIGDATLVGVSSGRSYIDPVGGGVSRYYWVRHVTSSNTKGPYNSSNGTVASTATDPAHILASITGAISVSQLSTSLANQIDGSGSAVDLSNLEAFVGFISTYDTNANGTLFSRLGGVETAASGLVSTFGNTASSASSASQANSDAAAAQAASVSAESAKDASLQNLQRQAQLLHKY